MEATQETSVERTLPIKILVTGDRRWSNVPRVIQALEAFPSGTVLVHGACRGADLTCAAVGEALGFQLRGYPAQWDVHGRAAGPIRNQAMLTHEHLPGEPINRCVAFHDDIVSSSGTKDMLRRVIKARIPCVLITSTSEIIVDSSRLYKRARTG